jgi:hypothetical protein
VDPLKRCVLCFETCSKMRNHSGICGVYVSVCCVPVNVNSPVGGWDMPP